MSNREVVVVSGVRTAIGDYGGALKDLPPTELGAIAIKEAVARAKVEPASVGHVVFGNVIHTEAQGHVPVARRGGRRRPAGRHAAPDGEPPVRLGPAGDRLRRAVHHARRLRRRGRRRRREHEPRRVLAARRRAGASAWATRGGRHDGRRAARPVRPRPHGHHRREHRREVRHHARAAGRVRRRSHRRAAQRDRGRLLQVADPADRAEEQEGRRAVRHRRARARRRRASRTWRS